jgi:hypothetical protein
MKRSSRPSRTSLNLSDSLHRQLNTYALAATAAGVSALALAQPAEAKIVYTPANVKLVIGKPFPLDLNHDGIVDFYLMQQLESYDSNGTNALSACHAVSPYSHGIFCTEGSVNSPTAIRVIEKNRTFAADLPAGATIQRGNLFPGVRAKLGELKCATTCTQRWYGLWVNGGKGVKNRYLGIRFVINGRFHYGWARMTVTTTSRSFTATLTGYAYETIPRKGIVAGATKGPDNVEPTAFSQPAPKPAKLGALALGAPGLAIWRREESVVTIPLEGTDLN